MRREGNFDSSLDDDIEELQRVIESLKESVGLFQELLLDQVKKNLVLVDELIASKERQREQKKVLDEVYDWLTEVRDFNEKEDLVGPVNLRDIPDDPTRNVADILSKVEIARTSLTEPVTYARLT